MIQVSKNIYRGPAPQSQGDVDFFKAQKVKMILNLENGLWEYLTGYANKEIEWAAPEIFVDHIDMSGILPPTKSELDTAMTILSSCESESLDCYVHCKHGVDRTGFVIAAYRVKVLGESWESAYQDMLEEGFHLFWFWWWIPSLKKYLEVG